MEMHIGVNQLIRKANSARLGSLESEEIDFFLNIEIRKFIKARRNPKANSSGKGYEKNRKRYDDLEELGESLTLPCYYRDATSVFSILPYNYFLMDRDHSNSGWSCSDISYTLSPVVIRYCIAPLNSGGIVSPFYGNFKIQLTDVNSVVTTIFDITNYPTVSSGLNTTEERFYLINLVIDELNKQGIEVWWEKWNDIYRSGSFIFLIPNGQSITITTATVDTTAFITTSFSSVVFSPTGNFLVANRSLEREDIVNSLNQSFRKATAKSPVSELEKRKLIVYHDKKFIPSSTFIKYIRKPQRVDLKLGYSSDISDSVHEEIVALTAQNLIAILQGQNYKEIINQNLIQE